MPLWPPLPRRPCERDMQSHGPFVDKEALRREESMPQELLMHVQQSLQGLPQHSVATLRGEGQRAKAAAMRSCLLHHNELSPLGPIAQDGVQVLMSCTELPEQSCRHLQLRDHAGSLLLGLFLFIFRRHPRCGAPLVDPAGTSNLCLLRVLPPFLRHTRPRALHLSPPLPVILVPHELAMEFDLQPNSGVRLAADIILSRWLCIGCAHTRPR
mmetsp:Transcript_50755/g.127919  ORF Transcript_50755/g.127919 Transcript_50755/m.127919 type:complete len:212 (+) Transcript_50755:794-1429(+)